MIVLDTNVLSEAIRPVPSRRVLNWLAAQQPSGLFTTAISEAELFYGLALLPAGKRRASLEEAVRRMLEEDFAQRVLPFDRAAASAFAVIASGRRKKGRPISEFDAQIAAVARINGAAVATRNADDFRDCGIGVIDPWTA
jgi:predicted nucleic acid-binding protein